MNHWAALWFTVCEIELLTIHPACSSKKSWVEIYHSIAKLLSKLITSTFYVTYFCQKGARRGWKKKQRRTGEVACWCYNFAGRREETTAGSGVSPAFIAVICTGLTKFMWSPALLWQCLSILCEKLKIAQLVFSHVTKTYAIDSCAHIGGPWAAQWSSIREALGKALCRFDHDYNVVYVFLVLLSLLMFSGIKLM